MTFLWPEMLWLLLLRAAAGRRCICVLLRRKKRAAVRYANLAHGQGGDGRGPALAPARAAGAVPAGADVMIVAVARPAAVVTLPSHARDGHPRDGRLGQHARRPTSSRPASRRRRPPRARSSPTSRATRAIGIVAFAGDRVAGAAADAEPRGHPGGDRPLPAAARHRGRQRHPGVAQGASFPDVEFDLRASNPRPRAAQARRAASLDKPQAATRQAADQAGAAGLVLRRRRSSCSPTARRTTGPDPIEAARMAADRGVRVFTVGIGTPDGEMHRLRRLVDARAARRGFAEERSPTSRAANTSTPAPRPT